MNRFIYLQALLFTVSASFTSGFRLTNAVSHRSPLLQRHATSSSSLSGDGKPKKKYPKDSVVKRLSQAAAQAQKRKRPKIDESSTTTGEKPPPLGSLEKLTHAIDQQIEVQYRTTQSNANRPARDSLIAVMTHNQQVAKKSSPGISREVAVVLAKPLKDDMITTEYAARIRRLVRAMKFDDFVPDAVCFVGGLSGNNRIADADAGYLFFRHLCDAQGVKLRDDCVIDLQRVSIDQGALRQLTLFLQQVCLPKWKGGQWIDINDGLSSLPPKKRLPIHFSFISSEYHLCQINDLHSRSPLQSVLRPLSDWAKDIVYTSWSFEYSTTVPEKNADPTSTFLTKHYKTAQHLIPVLMNLRAVADNKEFFQRDNYRVLVTVRRNLVSDMEALYERQPSLRSVRGITPEGKRLDLVLEGALLSLGRCLDLVRPAGLLTGSVTNTEFKQALVQLEQATHQLISACEMDRPLRADEWGTLGDDPASSWHIDRPKPPGVVSNATDLEEAS